MSPTWPNVALGDILTERRETPLDCELLNGGIRIVDKVTFNDGRIHLRHSQETKTGMILVRPGDILVSGINAAKGAIAIYDADASAPLAATIHYGAYQADKSRASSKFLWWLLRSNFFRDLLSHHVPGGIKTELKSKRLLPIPIPIPPLAEQHRIVARIEELTAKIDAARSLQNESKGKLSDFVASTHAALASSLPEPLSGFLELDEDGVPIEMGVPYPQIGVRGFGAGLFAKPPVYGGQTTYRAFNRLYSGALVMSQVKGWEGAVAMTPPEFEGYFVSPEYRTFRCNADRCLPEYMAALVPTEFFWSCLKDATRGVGARRERTRPEQFLQIKFSMPSLSDQKRAISMFATINKVQARQREIAPELEAMLPAILDQAFKGEL